MISSDNPGLRSVLIVGGGIAGLALATALGQRGLRCEIVELQDRPAGASIGLMGQAVNVLEHLGVLAACCAAGRVVEGNSSVFARQYDAAGEPLPMPPMPPRPDTRLPVAISLYRPLLARILREAALAQGARWREGLSVDRLHADEHGVDVDFSDGGQARYDLVVGADGLHSVVRPMLHDPQVVQPTYTGHMAFRAMFKGPHQGHPGFFVSGPHTVAVTHLPDDWTYLVSGLDLPDAPISQAEAQAHFRAVLGHFTYAPLQALRERLTGDQPVLVNPFRWLLLPTPWHRGRIALIGDAAHATTAHLSYGGGMALEDAAVMAEELMQPGRGVAAALDAFMARREARVRLVVETSLALLRLQGTPDAPRVMGQLRGRAMATLAMPY